MVIYSNLFNRHFVIVLDWKDKIRVARKLILDTFFTKLIIQNEVR